VASITLIRQAELEAKDAVRDATPTLHSILFDRCPKKTGRASRSIEVDDGTWVVSQAPVVIRLTFDFIKFQVLASMDVPYAIYIHEPWFENLCRNWGSATYREAYRVYARVISQSGIGR